MNNIKVIDTNIDVSNVLKEFENNSWVWQDMIQSFNDNLCHFGTTRNNGNNILLVSGPYLKGKETNAHSYKEWIESIDYFDNPKYEFRKTKYYSLFPNLLSIVHKYFPELEKNIARMIISRLVPGEVVLPHIDIGRYYYKNRFHVSISGTYTYTVGEEEVTIRPGTVFWFNNKIIHKAKNIGNEDRISLIIDVDPIYCEHLNLPINKRFFCSSVNEKIVYMK